MRRQDTRTKGKRMYDEQAQRSPVNMLITLFTGVLTGLVGVVYLTLGGIALLAILGFIYALLLA